MDDGSAFREFVTAAWPYLVTIAYFVTGDRGTAEDCDDGPDGRLRAALQGLLPRDAGRGGAALPGGPQRGRDRAAAGLHERAAHELAGSSAWPGYPGPRAAPGWGR
jgi:hypothetical protein